MNTIAYIASVSFLLATSSSSVVKPATEDGNFELLILHNNDMHARFEQTSQLSGTCTPADRDSGKCYGGFPRVAYLVNEARRKAATGEGPPVLYLNAGDTYTGTAWFTIYKWKIAAEFINALQPDAVCLGNHEFDNGVNGLIPFIKNVTCPVLAANLDMRKAPELAQEPNLKNSIILTVNNVQIGIVGYVTPETKVLAVRNDIEYIDEVVAIKKEVANLQEKGVKIIIALGHSGYRRDLEIAKEVEGLDLVIGGHTNTLLLNGSPLDVEESEGPYPTYVTQKSNRKVAVVQAYAYTKYLGKLHLIFDSDGEIITADGNPVLLDNTVPQDPTLMNIIKRYEDKVLAYSSEVVGNTSVVLDGKCQIKECNLGNLITDAIVFQYAAHYTGEYWTDAPIAIMQGGGIRTSIAHTDLPAVITKGDLLTVLPFDGSLVIVKMNGTKIFEMLEHTFYNYDGIHRSGRFLQHSGLKVIYDPKKSPGSRIVNVKARCGACAIPIYKNVENDQEYKIIMSDFIANGGDGYSVFKGLPISHLKYNELSSTIEYIKRHSPIYSEVKQNNLRLPLTLYNSKNAGISKKIAFSTLILTVFLILRISIG